MKKNKIQIAKDFFKVIVFLPFILILRVLNKFYPVRFKCLFVNRIGHQAAEFALYCREKEWNVLPKKKTVDLFYYYTEPANKYLMSLMKRKMRCLHFSWFIRTLHYSHNLIFGPKNLEMNWAYKAVFDKDMLSAQSSPLFTFKPFETKKGEQLVKQLFGCEPDEPMICFFNRDKAYLESNPGFEKCDFSYHDYRDSKIENYEAALLNCSFLDKYTFFRMGKIVEEPLRNPHPQIVDYASSPHRSDFLDTYLMARARFVICASTGFGQLSVIFRKKMTIVNVCPITSLIRNNVYFDPYVLGNLVIFKKYYSQEEKRILNLSEILKWEAQNNGLTEEYKNSSITLIENTETEVKDLAEEMEMRVNNEWEETFEDKELQNRFWDLVGVSNKNIHREHFPKIGSAFLKSNSWLLQ